MAMLQKQTCLQTEMYSFQQTLLPTAGQYIIAQYDQEGIVVYQAFQPSIAQYAVENQRFGGPDFSFNRMTWIKPNFMWMMYRSGWATKKGQERVLAIRITREGFDEILSLAFTAKRQHNEGKTNDEIQVRLQWDPDHDPNYHKLIRKAIQLGLKGEILRKYANQFILSIEDITPFVRQQQNLITKGDIDALMTPCERIYPLHNWKPDIADGIELDRTLS